MDDGGNGGTYWEFLTCSGLSPRTVMMYDRVATTAEGWWRMQGWDLRRASVTEVVAYLGTRPRSHATRSQLRSALRRYWDWSDHPRPPTGAIRVPAQPRMVCKALDDDDARLLAKAARADGDRRGLAVLLGLYQGMRRSEIACLRWDDFREGHLRVVGKGDKERLIPVHPVVAAAAELVPQCSEWCFLGASPGGHVSPATVWQWVREMSGVAGIPVVRTHRLRHTALAVANDITGDLRAVQELAGHSRPETTAGYTRVRAQRLRQVVESIDYG